MNKLKFGLRGVLAIAVAAATTFALIGLPHGGLAYDDDREQAATLVKQGDIRPLDDILEQALALHPGRVLEAELESKQAGYYYEVEVLDADGVMWELKFDASSGKLIDQEREY